MVHIYLYKIGSTTIHCLWIFLGQYTIKKVKLYKMCASPKRSYYWALTFMDITTKQNAKAL